MKIPSRNKVKYIDTSEVQEEVTCPYCKLRMKDITKKDYYEYLNTVIYCCRKCGEEFLPNQKNILYKYS